MFDIKFSIWFLCYIRNWLMKFKMVNAANIFYLIIFKDTILKLKNKQTQNKKKLVKHFKEMSCLFSDYVLSNKSEKWHSSSYPIQTSDGVISGDRVFWVYSSRCFKYRNQKFHTWIAGIVKPIIFYHVVRRDLFLLSFFHDTCWRYFYLPTFYPQITLRPRANLLFIISY